MAKTFNESGTVIQGKYKDCYVYVKEKNVSLSIHNNRIMEGTFFANTGGQSRVFVIDKNSIVDTQDMGSSVRKANSDAVMKIGFWFGATAAIAANQIGTQELHTVAVEYPDGERSLLQISSYAYETFKAIEFSLQVNKKNKADNQSNVSLESPERQVFVKPNRQILINTNNISASVKRANMFLEDKEWEKADEYFETILDIDPENAEAYLGKLMVDLKVCRREDLKYQSQPFIKNTNYQKAIRFADTKLENELYGYIDFINNHNDEEKRRKNRELKRQEEQKRRREKEKLRQEEEYCKSKYKEAVDKLNSASSAEAYKEAAGMFSMISDYKDSAVLADQCREKAECYRKDAVLEEAKAKMQEGKLTSYYSAQHDFKTISGWKDADEQFAICEKKITEINTASTQKEKKKKKKRVVAVSTIIISVIAVAFAIVILIKFVIIPNTIIGEAKKFAEQNNYLNAIEKLNELPNNQSAKDLSNEYLKSHGVELAKQLAKEGKYAYAANILMRCGLTDETKPLYLEYSNHTQISAGYDHTVGLKEDETVIATGNNSFGQCDVSDWEDIVAASAGNNHTVGLKKDGTVFAVGYYENDECAVSDWKDIVAVSAGNNHTVGLKKDGTVVAVGNNNSGQCDVSDWKDMVAISAGVSHTVGLKNDGTVATTEKNNNNNYKGKLW